MYFTDEAKKQVVAYRKAHDLMDYSLRIHASEWDGKLNYQVYWDNRQEQDDIVSEEEGFTVYTSVESNNLLHSTLVFVSEEEGEEGLFMMENQLDCASCMIDCF
ncbi:Fe-S cluster assembly iron-binding protein IscA [Natronobacillus azotifigens]|uniref:Uncharacterized protein n=1 Tax=Natronobacillus azotifigens TaxID=472978 RepID=A0A9J6RDI3_9BACI|nr:hypothetical protein [Natronobacillus azotifigens]MCZ0703736.1 hypothetical protein [Natronobacillus azotifigens]